MSKDFRDQIKDLYVWGNPLDPPPSLRKDLRDQVKDLYVRLPNDINGNPRYRIHVKDLCDCVGIGVDSFLSITYEEVLKRLRPKGAGRYSTKLTPYNVKVTSYNLAKHHFEFVLVLLQWKLEPKYAPDGMRLTNCCGTSSTYHDEILCCRRCYAEVAPGQGDGNEYKNRKETAYACTS